MPKSLIPYPGGKYYLASKIVRLLPTHRAYAEPFAGAANVLFAKPPSPVELINDIDESMINLYRVLKDEEGYKELIHRLRYTLYSRAEFARAIGIMRAFSTDSYTSIDKAWAKMVVSLQGFAGIAITKGNWGRTMYAPRYIRKYARKPESLYFFHERLRDVQVGCMDGIDFIRAWDSEDTLFYIDPPYALSTRQSKKIYKHELDDEYHQSLVELLVNIRGKAVVSHYLHPIYQELERAGYVRYEFRTSAFIAGSNRMRESYGRIGSVLPERLECLWVKSNI